MGEASVRAGRRDAHDDRPQRRPAPSPAARRHRQPPVLRLVPRRRARPRRASPRRCRGWCASSASSAPRRCRRPPTSWSRKRWPDLDWERAAATPRSAAARVREVRPARRLRDVRRLARGDAAVPGDGAAPSHRDVAAPEVPADRRVLLLHAQRLRARWCRGACSTTNGIRSWPTRQSSTPAGR